MFEVSDHIKAVECLIKIQETPTIMVETNKIILKRRLSRINCSKVSTMLQETMKDYKEDLHRSILIEEHRLMRLFPRNMHSEKKEN